MLVAPPAKHFCAAEIPHLGPLARRWTARPDLGGRWPSQLVATAAATCEMKGMGHGKLRFFYVKSIACALSEHILRKPVNLRGNPALTICQLNVGAGVG
jgi:hypothetical protein